MPKLRTMVKSKLDQWDTEAMLFCAQHGAKGGEFETQHWANGKTMIGPPGARCNQFIPEDAFNALKARSWKVYG